MTYLEIFHCPLILGGGRIGVTIGVEMDEMDHTLESSIKLDEKGEVMVLVVVVVVVVVVAVVVVV